MGNDLERLMSEGATACEQFVKDQHRLDLAFLQGDMNKWIEEQLKDEFNRAERQARQARQPTAS